MVKVSTKNLKRQHVEILELMIEILVLLEKTKIEDNVDTIRKLISLLSGKLHTHLAMEDKVLYPQLLENKNDKVKKMAQQFIEDTGNIRDSLHSYNEKWRITEEIKKNSGLFLVETKSIFKTLKRRIKNEETKLFSLVEQGDI